MLRLRIFAFHIESIMAMRNGEANTYAPLEGLRIVVSIDGNFYKVDGLMVGNSCGAVAEYARIVSDFCVENKVVISPVP